MASPVQMAKKQARQMADIQASLDELTQSLEALRASVAEVAETVSRIEQSATPKTTTRKRTAKS
jgi:prefoldin subunit 5